MADLSDVMNAVKATVLAALYPAGVPTGGISPLAPAQIAIMTGWPAATVLDGVAASIKAPTQQAIVSIFQAPGMYRNTSRFPTKWQTLTLAAATVTAMVDDVTGTTITIGGTAGAGQNIGALVGFGTARQPFVYQTVAGDTLATIAAGLAALINATTAASAVGPVVNVPASYSLVARTGGTGVAIQERRRQMIRVQVDIWTPSPALRDLIAEPIRVAIDEVNFLVAASDNTALRIICAGDHWLDDPAKAGIYRRLLAYDVEYPTTVTMTAAQILFFQQQLELGTIAPLAPAGTSNL